MLKVKHERDCDCVVAGFRWHKNGEGTAIGSLLLGLYDDDGQPRSTSASARASPTAKRRELVDVSGAVSRERARRPSVARVGRGAMPTTARAAHAGRRRAAGARARICRGSRCARSWSSRWRTITCRAPASGTRRSSAAGGPTSARATARSRSSRWSPPQELAAIFASGTLVERGFARFDAVSPSRATRASDRRPDPASPAAAASLPARCAGSRGCASTSTSGRASNRPARRRPRGAPAASGCFAFQRSRPASAASLSGEFATTMSGIFVRGARAVVAFARPSRATARRAAPRLPSSESAAATARRRARPLRRAPRARAARRASRRASSIPACGSPISANRSGTVQHGEVRRIAVGNLVPVAAASRRARRAAAAPNTPSTSCGPWRSGCSRGRRRAAPPSTTSTSRAPARAARSRARTRARRGALR